MKTSTMTKIRQEKNPKNSKRRKNRLVRGKRFNMVLPRGKLMTVVLQKHRTSSHLFLPWPNMI